MAAPPQTDSPLVFFVGVFVTIFLIAYVWTLLNNNNKMLHLKGFILTNSNNKSNKNRNGKPQTQVITSCEG